MKVIKLEEHGYNSALYGFSLSYKDRAISREEWWPICCEDTTCNFYCKKGKCSDRSLDRRARIESAAIANAGRGHGHDKWLRQVVLWLDIEAPRYWWSEFDTYKVGTVAQSESTMHTLSRRPMTLDDCVYTDLTRSVVQDQVNVFNSIVSKGTVQEIKQCVPEAYLQRRVVTLNYAVFQCIINQRKNHRLPEWHTFIDAIYSQVAHPELLPERE